MPLYSFESPPLPPVLFFFANFTALSFSFKLIALFLLIGTSKIDVKQCFNLGNYFVVPVYLMQLGLLKCLPLLFSFPQGFDLLQQLRQELDSLGLRRELLLFQYAPWCPLSLLRFRYARSSQI